MLTVSKFGGSSLCDAIHFLTVRDIVLRDPARRVVVVSAAGKRHPTDQKITDLLYLCHAHVRYGVPCRDLWQRICARYIAIRDGCGLTTPIEAELEAIYADLSPALSADYLASRGEYLSARLMADLLGYDFVDATDWLQFDHSGHVLPSESYATLRALAAGRPIVTPGFYGALPDGAIHTFSRGGSDVTGALAAAALQADLYENWTDVLGVLDADPNLVPEAEPISHLCYGELQALGHVGMQVLHESAVAPVRELDIPLQIRSTCAPDHPGTRITAALPQKTPKSGVVGFAGRKGLSLLHLESPAAEPDVSLVCRTLDALEAAGQPLFHLSWGLGHLTVHTSQKAVQPLTTALASLSVQENQPVAALAVLCRGEAPASVLDALAQAQIPVLHRTQAGQCLLLTLREADYEKALRAVYAAK